MLKIVAPSAAVRALNTMPSRRLPSSLAKCFLAVDQGRGAEVFPVAPAGRNRRAWHR
jgi:hypothetical protein